MKIIIILLIGVAVVGPILVLYNLGVKHKKNRRTKLAQKAKKKEKEEAIKQASKYKIKF